MKALFVTLHLLAGLSCFSQRVVNFNPSPVHFSIKNAGLDVTGAIEGLEGAATFNGNNIIIAIQASLQPSTIRTGIRLRDDHLKKEDYFNVAVFPKVNIVSTQIRRKRHNSYVGNFDLTIKNITKNFVIPFQVLTVHKQHTVKGQFTLDRRDFGLGEESVILSDEVIVDIDLLLKQ